jgi:hypothetical protein
MIPFKSGGPTPRDRDLQFCAEVTSPYPVEVFWQVVNTGIEAAAAHALRGEIIEARDRWGNHPKGTTEHWESTQYKGCHEVRALLVSGTRVVAESEYFKVPIY